MSNILDALGITNEAIETAKAEPSTGGFLWESGAYPVEIKQLAVFETASGAKMLKIEMYDEKEDKTLVEYANTSYIDKQTKERKENMSGVKIFKSLMSAIKLEPAAIQLVDKEIDAYAKKVQAQVITNAEGRKCVALVREVEDPNNEKYPLSNVVEAFADIENKINGETAPVEKWLEKIAKAPVLVKKAKKSTQTAAKAADTDAAKSLLG